MLPCFSIANSRLREKVPCALVAGDEKSSFNAAVSDGQDEATPPGEFEGKVVQGTAAAAAAVAARDATSSGGGNSKKSKGGAGEGGDGGTARSAALLSSRRVSSEQGTSGRKGKRKMDLGVEVGSGQCREEVAVR